MFNECWVARIGRGLGDKKAQDNHVTDCRILPSKGRSKVARTSIPEAESLKSKVGSLRLSNTSLGISELVESISEFWNRSIRGSLPLYAWWSGWLRPNRSVHWGEIRPVSTTRESWDLRQSLRLTEPECLPFEDRSDSAEFPQMLWNEFTRIKILKYDRRGEIMPLLSLSLSITHHLFLPPNTFPDFSQNPVVSKAPNSYTGTQLSSTITSTLSSLVQWRWSFKVSSWAQRK